MSDELKELWRLSFGDTAEYTDFYFSRRYRPENTCTVSANGRIVSAAQFAPYEISCLGRIISGAYILGVCTHPDYRRRGYSSEVMQRMLDRLRGLGFELAFLIPAQPYLFNVYAKHGFIPSFSVYRAYAASVSGGACEIFSNASTDDAFGFYDRFYRSLPCAVLKTREDFLFAMDDIAVSGGQTIICGDKSGIRGFAAVEGGAVKELLADAQARDTLLSRLLAEHGPLTVTAPLAFPGSARQTIGMTRVLKPPAFNASSTPDISESAGYLMSEGYANLLLN